MQDIRKERQKNLIAWKKFQLEILKFRFWIIKKKWWLLSFLIALSFIIFPIQIGTALGTWITDFLGSIIENIKM